MTWTHRERVLAALNHEQADRVPMDLGGAGATTIVLEAYEKLKNHLGLQHETAIMSRRNVLAHPDESVLQRFDIDTRGAQVGGYQGGHQRVVDESTEIDEFGVTWKCTSGTQDIHYLHVDGPFYQGKLTVDRVEEFDWPDPNNPGLVKGVRERIEEIKAAGDHAVVLYLPGGVIHRGYAMRGFENFLKDLYKNREAVCRLMDKLADYWVGTAENVLRTVGPENIDVAFFGEDLGTQDGCMFDPDSIYKSLIKPRHRRMVETVKSLSKAKICFHCCGSAYHFIDHLADIGVDALNPVQVTAKNMEPERLKGEFGERMAFWGGINSQQLLPYANADEVATETERVIDIFGKGGGYVLNSVHNIQAEVPPENVVAMFDTGRRHVYQ